MTTNEHSITGFYAVIPANIRRDKRLTADEILLYADITSLTRSTGECWASNAYLANIDGTSERTISRRVNKLIQLGYISVRMIEPGKYNKNNRTRVIILSGTQFTPPTEKKKEKKKSNNEIATEKDANEIYEIWNNAGVTVHTDSTKGLHIATVIRYLKKFDKDFIISAIKTYSKVVKSKFTYYNHKFTLSEFLERRNGIMVFCDATFDNYLTDEGKKKFSMTVTKDDAVDYEKRWLSLIKSVETVALDDKYEFNGVDYDANTIYNLFKSKEFSVDYKSIIIEEWKKEDSALDKNEKKS